MNYLKKICLICKSEIKREGKGVCISCEKNIYQGPAKSWLEAEKAVKDAYLARYK